MRFNAGGDVPNPPGEVTALLRAWDAGDQDAYRRVSAILYGELRRQAARYLRHKTSDDTLQATALLHEAFIRLADAGQIDWQDRRHFLAVAARTMRRVLVDAARARSSAKRGAGAVHVPLESDLEAAGPSPLDLLALDRALERLATFDPRTVRVVEFRFFAGLTVEETANILDVAPDTIARDWRRLARTWLRRELGGGSNG